jgi:hypothetical protein
VLVVGKPVSRQPERSQARKPEIIKTVSAITKVFFAYSIQILTVIHVTE